MQHTASSTLPTETALVTPSQTSSLQPTSQESAVKAVHSPSRIGPDLSGAIERVLAWHRSRNRH